MPRKIRPTLFAAAALAILAGPAFAQTPAPGLAVNAGGRGGAYLTQLCPPLIPALSNAYFNGYGCVESPGSVENIRRVLAAPSALGFVQADVLALHLQRTPADQPRLAVVREDIACEGLFAITRNPTLTYGQVVGLARRIRFVTPPVGSGSAATLDFLRSIDPEGLGRLPDAGIERVDNAMAVIERIAASSQGEVGFFVQTANPKNALVQRLAQAAAENGVRILPVISHPILRAAVDGKKVYEAQAFPITEGGLFNIGGRAQTVTTACTKVVLLTGSEAAGHADAGEMVQRIGALPRTAFLPQDGALAALLTRATRLTQGAADAIANATDTAKNAVAGQ
jgi:hypothetical protein